ncbi:MAG: sugar kinase [Herpetosiphonaceae bacterium]|nr:MAG: sugar kinase [Herpetosiphonaceae bacterium]
MQQLSSSHLPAWSSKATPPALKRHNAQLILRLLREHGSLSRAELARRTHLSRPAISDIVRGLIDEGLIEEIGMGSSQGGKRPTLIGLRADARQIIGVDLGAGAITGLRADLHARVLSQAQAASAADYPDSLDSLFAVVDNLMAEGEGSPLGIGIATPGLIDTVAGTVVFAANLGWRQVPLARILRERYKLPIYIDNDTHLAALGEFHFGAGQGSSPLAVVRVGTGIGAGLILNGQIYSGANGWSGEIGHLAVVEHGERCVCGRRGCLETVASVSAIVAQARRLAAREPGSILGRLAAESELDISSVQRAVERGDSAALALIRSAGFYLGVALASLVHIFNPRRIVLAGSVIRCGTPFFAAVREGLDSSALQAIAAATEIAPATLGERAGMMGAVALVLNRELGIF